MVRVSALRNPLKCEPPSTVLMLFAKLKTLSEYPSLYCSATSMLSSAAIRQLALAFEVNRLLVQHRLAFIQVLDELRDSAAVVKLMLLHRLRALIGQRDGEAFVQERQLTQPLRQRVEVELRGVHDGGVGLERDLGAGLLAGLARLRRAEPCGMPFS